MGRPRRQIISGQVYEICIRTTEGLPFVCTTYMKLILESIMARVQRDQKVSICHYLWMGNHLHMLIVAWDCEQCKKFHGELKKQITDAVKQLLGKEHLTLWQKNGTSLVRYGDKEGVRHRIAYLYANPARANLVDSINSYPGLNSWQDYRSLPHTLAAQHSKYCPWVRKPAIEKLPAASLSPGKDRAFAKLLRKRAKEVHELSIEPNAWMRAFGVEEGEVQRENEDIVERLESFESAARRDRREKRLRVMGVERLIREPLSLKYRSKSKGRRIFVYALAAEIRVAMIQAYKQFCEQCRECYQRWKVGEYDIEWPPGAFIPAMPPRMNHFCL